MSRAVAIGECMVELAPAGAGLYRQGFAGDTFNAAFYLRRRLPADWRVDYLSALGTDALSDRMAAFMEACGVGTAHLARLPGRSPGLYLIETAAGERRFHYWRGQSAARRLAEDPARLRAALAGASLALFSGITLAILPPRGRAALLSALAAARAAGTLVAFDSNLRRRLWPSLRAMRAGAEAGAAAADVALPSFDEEAAAFGDRDPEETLARYRALGCATVAVKNGAGAVTGWDRAEGTARVAPPAPEAVVDTTAAGDAFGAAFLAARLTGAALAPALAAGCALAARVVARPGALVEA